MDSHEESGNIETDEEAKKKRQNKSKNGEFQGRERTAGLHRELPM